MGITAALIGENSEAIIFANQALASTREACGNEHIDTLHLMICLADVLTGLGDYEAALPLQQDALDISTVLGSDEAFIMLAQASLGTFRLFFFSYSLLFLISVNLITGMTFCVYGQERR